MTNYFDVQPIDVVNQLHESLNYIERSIAGLEKEEAEALSRAKRARDNIKTEAENKAVLEAAIETLEGGSTSE